MGIGAKKEGQDLADYVLGKFSKEDRAALGEVLDDVKKAVGLMLWDDIAEAMNQYNKKKKEEKKEEE